MKRKRERVSMEAPTVVVGQHRGGGWGLGAFVFYGRERGKR